MTEPMKPTDVPNNLAAIAARRLREWPHSGSVEELGARRILAAVIVHAACAGAEPEEPETETP